MATRGANNQLGQIATSDQNAATQAQQNNQQTVSSAQNQQNSLMQTLAPAYQSILANPGYTPAQQSSITNATMGSLGATYDSLKNQADLTAARTRNDASSSALLDDLARQHGTDAAALAAKNQTNFANNSQQQQDMALKGLSGLYGQNMDTLRSSLGLAPQYMSGATSALNAQQPGFWEQFGNNIAGTLSGNIGGKNGKASI